MLRSITILGLLICVGCATSPEKKSLVLVAQTEALFIRVMEANGAYEVSATLCRPETGGPLVGEPVFGEVDSAPRLTAKVGEWNAVQVVTRVGGCEPSVSHLIDGELIAASAHAGVTLKVFGVPADNGRARVKGMLVRSSFDEQRGLSIRSFPFDAEFVLGEWTLVYEKGIQLDPSSKALP